jgi:DNA polymerase
VSEKVSKRCYIDIESFSDQPLPKVGVYRYAESPVTEILCIAYAFGDEPPNLWIPHDVPKDLQKRIITYAQSIDGYPMFGPKVPMRLTHHADNGGKFWAHNSQFERIMLKGNPGKKINFPKTKRSQWFCTAAKAAVHALPRDLGRLAEALKTPHLKDEDGKMSMMQVTKPRKPSKLNPDTRWTPENSPDRFYNLYTYCVDDVFTERDVDHAVPDLTKTERRIFLMDQEINDRGWMIDQPRIADVQVMITQYKAYLKKKFKSITGFTPGQNAEVAKWVREHGVEIENLQKQTIIDALKNPEMPENVRHALRIRSMHEMKAPVKYSAMERAVCSDGALRGMFVVHAASTGRWSSRIVQLQNLFRSVIEDAHVAIEAFRLRSVKWIKVLYSQNPMIIFASCVRGMLIAREGRDLLFADYSAIEARIVAWLADSKDMLKIYRTHGLAYEYTASKMFGYPLELEDLKIFKKEHPMLRFLGKIAVLALGYQGGGAAFVKMAKQFGTNVSFEKGEDIKHDWRNSNALVEQMWFDIQDAAIAAVHNPGVTFKTNRLMFRVVGDYLYMRLPSKRKLAYYKPHISLGGLRFWAINSFTNQWCICSTYGGKLLQNAAEGIARDLMTNAMFKLRKKKIYPMLGTVHDEIITEPKEGEGSVEEVCEIMCDKKGVEWAETLPIRAVGMRTKRYRK